ncbi:MAG TPA: hypothetical protein VK277_12275 [Acidimicrobiales bacterium]|nr:hypothetical protein [Acidimicrobiales bacterium]
MGGAPLARAVGLLALWTLGVVATAGPVAASERGAAGGTSGVFKHAVKVSESKGSAEVSFVVGLAAPGLGSVPIVKVVGEQTFRAPLRAHFVLTIPSGSGNGETSLHEILVGNTVYLRIGGAWYEQSTQAALGQVGLSGSLSSSDPTQILQVLEARGAVVTKVGSRTLAGVATTEYRAVISVAQAEQHLGSTGISATPAALKEFSQLSSSPTYPVTVWLDSDSRIRQLKIELPLSHAALANFGLQDAPSGVSLSIALTFSHYGVKVVAPAPPASEVHPVPTTTTTTAASG